MEMSRPKVFLSYNNKDSEIADRIIDELSRNKIHVFMDKYTISLADSVNNTIEKMLSASDYIILLLSENYSSWQEYEILKSIEINLTKRDITILPVLVNNNKLPNILNSIQYIDLTKDFERGLQELVTQIINSSLINFAKLTPLTFEEMIVDLFHSLGFLEIQRNIIADDCQEIDIVAKYPYTDPFGDKRLETWIVETKFYKNSRLDIKSIQQLHYNLVYKEHYTKGLLVTNGHLTSASKRYFESLPNKEKKDMKIIEGNELKRLILKNKKLVTKYFE